MTRSDVQSLWDRVGVPLIVGALSAVGSSYVSLEIATARMQERFAAMDRIIVLHHERISALERMNTDHAAGPLSEHREFRERIARLESENRQIMHRLKME
jgi:hypothetical protein